MLDENKPGNVYRKLVRPVWDKISIYDGPDAFLAQFHSIRRNIGHLYAAHWCQSEVCNGGFHQFFSNSTGVLAPEALAGFLAIGLTEWAAVLKEAMEFFGHPFPRDRSLRLEQLSAREGKTRKDWDPFYSLDDRFYHWLHEKEDRWNSYADQYASKLIESDRPNQQAQ